MTLFVTVNAIARTVQLQAYNDLLTAQAAMGLTGVDHGSFGSGFGYVVDEFGLYVPRDAQRYLAAGRTLIAGSMVVYAYDLMGKTRDMTESECQILASAVLFFETYEDVEIAIAVGVVNRPQIAVDGLVVWRWPEARRGDIV